VADEQEGPENVLGIDTTILGVIDDAVSIGDAERRIPYWNAAGHHRSCSGMAPHLGRLSYLAPMNSAPHSTVAAQEGLFGGLVRDPSGAGSPLVSEGRRPFGTDKVQIGVIIWM
jgi:hypothetical protein